MTDRPVSAEAIAEVLRVHDDWGTLWSDELDRFETLCDCGQTLDSDGTADAHRAHLAAVLASSDWVREERAAARREVEDALRVHANAWKHVPKYADAIETAASIVHALGLRTEGSDQ